MRPQSIGDDRNAALGKCITGLYGANHAVLKQTTETRLQVLYTDTFCGEIRSMTGGTREGKGKACLQPVQENDVSSTRNGR